MRIALAQFDFPVGAVAANARRIEALIDEARDLHRADVVLFPELAICGYPPEDLLLRPSFLAACDHELAAIAARTRGIVALVGHPQPMGSVVYNALSVLRDGGIELTYRKRELPNYAVFDEQRYFTAGEQPAVIDVAGVGVGLLVCEDLWHAGPMRQTAAAGAEVVLVANASPFEGNKPDDRDALLAQRARESGAALAYLNVVGGQDELVFDGATVLADADGTVHPAARAFEDHWLVAEYHRDGRRFSCEHWAREEDDSALSLQYRALVRATRDYVHKNGFADVLLGLSGGIDSALTLQIAVDALGAGHVTGVRLPARYTSGLSNDLASEQARDCGIALQTLSIEPVFERFLDVLAPVLAGAPPGVTEENLQSRCRGVLLMALSNRTGALVLTTGNKSEYAVGYATIYGDMCGAFAPLKDVFKTEVYALSRWRNARGGTIPQAVIDRPPTAELREGQTDQDSLPPYEVLDAILQRFVDREMSRAEIIAEGFEPATVERVAALVFRSEWKRRQSAPGPKVSRKAFGRDRRYPITSGWGRDG
jgi:NAD+ synthase (glutamine-hydrolysing)